MKDKTIRKILRYKMNKFLDSIEDQGLREDIKKNSFITGGCIVSMMHNEPVNDYDMYFTNKDTVIRVCEYYIEQFLKAYPVYQGTYTQVLYDDKGNAYSEEVNLVRVDVNEQTGRVKIFIKSQGVAGENQNEDEEDVPAHLKPEEPEKTEEEKKLHEKKFRPVYLTSNAISLTDEMQLIIRFYGEPSEVHKNYDFLHCTAFWAPENNELHYSKEALKAIMDRNLIYSGSLYPLCSIFRIRKFIKRGWSINAGQILKMGFQLSKLDLSNRNVLEDQLVGVDSAYFGMIITALQSQEKKQRESGELKPEDVFVVDQQYVMQLIDEVFDES